MRWWTRALGLSAALAPFGAAPALAQDAAPAPVEAPAAAAPGALEAAGRWCAPALEERGEGACVAGAPGAAPRVIFLHGVIQPDTTWQWSQQRAITRGARANGFLALMPRGRRGIGPEGMRDWWTWPTSVAAQRQVEEALLDEWADARRRLEQKRGRPFERLLVYGFSNGAYYASSLALRGRVEADGFAVFAGGSAPQHLKRLAAGVRRRAPVYVGYGETDRGARGPARELGEALETLRWKHRLVGRRRVGHSMTDEQMREAFQFLRGR